MTRGAARTTSRASSRVLRLAVVLYVACLVALPLVEIARRAWAGGPRAWGAVASDPIAVHALWTSLITASVVALVNGILGTLTAWALVRWRFPGRGVIAALVDLPLAIPTLLTGILLVELYGPRTWIGGRLDVVFATPGIVLALLFVTFPLGVRAVEPVLRELDPAEEEAARTLGATPWTTVRRIVLPAIAPAIVSGAAQSFARALAEFGSLVVVSGNVPRETLTAPVFVFGEVEAGHLDVAATASVVLLGAALVVSLGARAIVRNALRAHAV